MSLVGAGAMYWKSSTVPRSMMPLSSMPSFSCSSDARPAERKVP